MGLDLITLDEYKTLEGITSTQYDDKFDALITSTSQLVKTYCGTDFVDNTGSPGVAEIFDIQWSTYVVQLRRSPVIQIYEVAERSSQSEAYTVLYRDGQGSPAEYSWYFDSVSDSVFRTNEDGSYKNWPCGVGSVKVTYSSGYTALPEDLKLAIVDLVTYYNKDEYKERQSLGSTTRESIGTSSVRNDPNFPDHIRRVLDLYRTI